MHIRRCSILSAAVLAAAASQAQAGPDFPFLAFPDSVPGMDTGALQPKDTLVLRGRTAQPLDVDEGTGRQTYGGALSWRGEGRFQLGASFTVFDDPPAQPIGGATGNLTFGGVEASLKYALIDEGPLEVAARLGAGYFAFDQDDGASGEFAAGTASVAATYALSDRFSVNGEIGATVLGDDLDGAPGFGTRGFAAIGAGYAVTDRLFVYGNAKALFGGGDDGPEGDVSAIYSAGARYALTPQLAATAYATTGFTGGPIADDIAFFPARDDPALGLELTYVPSGKRPGKVARYKPGRPASDVRLSFSDGITLEGPAVIGTDSVRTKAFYGSSGNGGVLVSIQGDPDFHIDLGVERYALEDGNAFRDPGDEAARFLVGIRYQMLAEAEGAPLDFGVQARFSRDTSVPTIGAPIVGVSARKSLGERADVTFAPKIALFGDEEIAGAGFGLGFDATRDLRLMAEYTAVSGGDGDVYALGARYEIRSANIAADLYATNASGLDGLGSLLAGEAQLGVALHFQGGTDLF